MSLRHKDPKCSALYPIWTHPMERSPRCPSFDSLDGPGLKCPSLTNHWWEEPIIETCPEINGKIKWLEQKIRWKTKARQHIHNFAVPSGDPATHTEWHALVAISQSLSIAGLVPPQVKPAGKRTFAIWPQAAAYGAPWYPANICSQLRQPGFWQTGVDEVVSSSFASLPPQQKHVSSMQHYAAFKAAERMDTHQHIVIRLFSNYMCCEFVIKGRATAFTCPRPRHNRSTVFRSRPATEHIACLKSPNWDPDSIKQPDENRKQNQLQLQYTI